MVCNVFNNKGKKYFNKIKALCDKPIASIIHIEKFKTFPLRSCKKPRYLLCQVGDTAIDLLIREAHEVPRTIQSCFSAWLNLTLTIRVLVQDDDVFTQYREVHPL